MGRIVDDLQLLADAQQPDFLRPTWIDLEPFTNELLAKAAAHGVLAPGWSTRPPTPRRSSTATA